MTPATISASEFRQNFGKYLALVENQDFQITKNGKVVALWTNPHKSLVDKLAGSIHASINLEKSQDERRSKL